MQPLSLDVVERVVITGVPGFVGGEFLRFLRTHHKWIQVVCLIRPVGNLSAQQRLLQLVDEWKKHHDLALDFLENIEVVSHEFVLRLVLK